LKSGLPSEQALVHDRRRLGQQFAEHRCGNIRPQPALLGKGAVLLGALDQARKAGLGNARAAIVGDAERDLAIAAPHQLVGDRLAERRARRNGLQMRLTLGSRDADKVVLRQARRRLSTGPATAMSSSAISRRKTLTGVLLTGARRFASSARLRRSPDQNPEHVVEQADVLVAAAGSIEKGAVCAGALHALLPGAVLDDLFEFGDQREAGTHFPIHEIRRMARCPRPR
jgi:hypothetical protein